MEPRYNNLMSKGQQQSASDWLKICSNQVRNTSYVPRSTLVSAASSAASSVWKSVCARSSGVISRKTVDDVSKCRLFQAIMMDIVRNPSPRVPYFSEPCAEGGHYYFWTKHFSILSYFHLELSARRNEKRS